MNIFYSYLDSLAIAVFEDYISIDVDITDAHSTWQYNKQQYRLRLDKVCNICSAYKNGKSKKDKSTVCGKKQKIYFIHRILVHKNTATAFIFRFHLIFRSWFLSDDNLDNFLEELGQIVVVLGAAIHVETSPGLPSRLDSRYSIFLCRVGCA